MNMLMFGYWVWYWILSSQMTKTLRDNCGIYNVQQTSYEPLFPDVQIQLKTCFSFLLYVHICITIVV